jgi:phage head maturation protease
VVPAAAVTTGPAFFYARHAETRMNKIQKRELILDTRRADTKRRSVPAVLSTEHAVDRGDYLEVLLHGPENVDLSRAPLPLIENHDGSPLNVGLVDNLRLTGGKLRGDLVLGNSARALELWPDIEAGIIRHLSIGYLINDVERRDGGVLAATRWQPYEASLVSIPADPNAGTYRSFDMERETDNTEHLSRSQRRAQKAESPEGGVDAERARVRDILDNIHVLKGTHFNTPGVNLDEISERAIRERWTLPMMRDEVSARRERTQQIPSADICGPYIGGRHQDREYSLTRMLASIIDPRSVDAGYEREVSQELAHRMGRKPNGFYMPLGPMSGQRDLTVAGAPALVGTQHTGAEFIDILRNRSFVMRLGPRVLAGLTQDVSIPRLTSSATSGWIAGDGVDGLTPSQQALDSASLTPHTVGALTPLSRKMVLQGDPDAENMIRQDFGRLIAVELDRAAIAGSGAANQPVGITNTTGVTVGTYPLAGPDFASVVAMEGALMADNADFGSLAYLTTPPLASSPQDYGDGQRLGPVRVDGRSRARGRADERPAGLRHQQRADRSHHLRQLLRSAGRPVGRRGRGRGSALRLRQGHHRGADPRIGGLRRAASRELRGLHPQRDLIYLVGQPTVGGGVGATRSASSGATTRAPCDPPGGHLMAACRSRARIPTACGGLRHHAAGTYSLSGDRREMAFSEGHARPGDPVPA